MSAPRMDLALWAGAALLVAAAILGVRRSLHGESDATTATATAASGLVRHGESSAEDPAYGVDHDPFRLARHPASVAYRPELEGVAPPPPPPKPPHPLLVLGGILGGPPWEALLDGVPGHDGSVVVHQGQMIGDLRIRSVTRDSVIVQGADTTWRLGIRRSWQ